MSRIGSITQSSSRQRTSLFPAPLALAIALGVGSVHAATIAVNSAGTDSETGQCTIVDAVAALNSQMPVNGCAAGNGGDIIDLSFFTSPTTITFSTIAAMQSHALVLNNPATISGPLDVSGAPLVTLTRSTVSGTPAFGIIHNSAPLTIDGVKITNGNSGEYSGGGVLGGDSLTILHSVISGNGSDSAGGGVSATQDLTVRNSTISGNTAGNAGGGIDGESSVSIYYSTVSNNSTSGATTSVNGGGGVFATGFLKVMNSDVLNNASASAGGGVYAATGINISNSTLSGNTAMAGSGGGAYANTNSTNVTVSQSTFNDNTAQGNGGGFLGGTAVIQNSTFTGNMASGTGGAVQAGTLTLSYDTIAQNQSTGNGGGANFSSSADIGGTILYGNTPQDLTGAAAATGQYDIVEVSTVAPTGSLTCDPKLAALADNGGPTQTMALGTGSCAIDAASASPSIGNDQRGFGRPVGSGANPLADIGAFEAGAKDPDVIFADAFGG